MDTKEITEKLNLKCGVFAPLLAFGEFPADRSSLIQTDKWGSNSTQTSDTLFQLEIICLSQGKLNAMQQQQVQ